MGDSSKLAPSPVTFHWAMFAPCGMYTNPTRRTAGVFTAAESAGTIESSRGNAREAPTPRRNVLRGNDFPIMIMIPLSSSETARL